MVEAAASGDATTSEPWQFQKKENRKRKAGNLAASYGNGVRVRRIENWDREWLKSGQEPSTGKEEALFTGSVADNSFGWFDVTQWRDQT